MILLFCLIPIVQIPALLEIIVCLRFLKIYKAMSFNSYFFSEAWCLGRQNSHKKNSFFPFPFTWKYKNLFNIYTLTLRYINKPTARMCSLSSFIIIATVQHNITANVIEIDVGCRRFTSYPFPAKCCTIIPWYCWYLFIPNDILISQNVCFRTHRANYYRRVVN